MSPIFDNDAKERIRSAIDIVDLISQGAEVRRKGQSYVTRCPWHNDNDPSLTIDRTRQSWKCWVCDIGGDVFSWVMQREGVTFPEALSMLAEHAGIEFKPMQQASLVKSRQTSKDKKSLFETAAWVASVYHQYLLQNPAAESARRYLTDRGITEDSWRRFQIGMAPNEWNWLVDLASAKGVSPGQLKSVDAIAQSQGGKNYDRFKGRIVFPIRDAQGRSIAMGGRILPEVAAASEAEGKKAAKYVNSTETRLYSKSNQLYGLDLARASIQRNNQAIVVEGYTDVIMAHQFGVDNAVAVCGTALGSGHIELLRRYCDSVLLLLDGDEAGQRRTNEILELFVVAETDLRILTLPNEMDPCDYLLKHGADALRAELSKSVDALEHKIRIATDGFDPLLDTHRANRSIDDILGLIAQAPVRQKLGDSVQLKNQQIINRLSRQFGVDVEQIRGRLKSIRNEQSRRRANQLNRDGELYGIQQSFDQPPGQHVAPYRFADLSLVDQEVFEICIEHPELVGLVIERIEPQFLSCDAARALMDVYQQLDLEGEEVDFGSVMLVLENLDLKNILVSLQQRVDAKARLVRLDAMQRIDSLLQPMVRAERERLQRQIERSKDNEEEELRILQEIIAREQSNRE